MSAEDAMTALGGWQGYRVSRLSWTDRKQRPHADLIIELTPLPDHPMACSGCGDAVFLVHDVQIRQVLDLPMLEYRTVVMVPRRRVHCHSCGPKLEALEWLEPYARVTNRFAESIARLCDQLPIKLVADHYDLHWGTVKSIHLEYLTTKLGPPDVSGVSVIAMDEFAIQKGHRYATVVVDALTKRVLWVGRGRSRADIRPFFDLLGISGCLAIKAAVMDMNGAYDLEVRLHCPQAEIVYDQFHVVAKYAREVIDRVRVNEANRLRADKPARKLVKTAKWILLRNRENLKGDEPIRLAELLRANRALSKAYILKDDLKQLWDFTHEPEAQTFWNHWYRRASSSGVDALKAFARKLKPYLPGLLAHCRWPLNTSFLEGMNNRIKVIKRMAYGYRDDAYFFLRIRAAFPGKP
jgi:transposase